VVNNPIEGVLVVCYYERHRWKLMF
jgi:hypothetical protein